MTREELRVALHWWCGCGSPDDAAASLLRLLELAPFYEHQAELDALMPDPGLRWITLYVLDHFDLIEHGGTVSGAWLSPQGVEVRDALRREAGTNFDFLNATACIHGYDMDSPTSQTHRCT